MVKNTKIEEFFENKLYNLNYRIDANQFKLFLTRDADNFPSMQFLLFNGYGSDLTNFSAYSQSNTNEAIKKFFNQMYFDTNVGCPIKQPDVYKNVKLKNTEENLITININNQKEEIIKLCLNTINNLINKTQINSINAIKRDYVSIVDLFLDSTYKIYNLAIAEKKKSENLKKIEKFNLSKVTYEIKISTKKNNLFFLMIISFFFTLLTLLTFLFYLNLNIMQKKEIKKKIISYIFSQK
jgi:hypothetical protein